jgi:hypothetical protein
MPVARRNPLTELLFYARRGSTERATVESSVAEQDESLAVYEDRTREIREIPVVRFEKRTASA